MGVHRQTVARWARASIVEVTAGEMYGGAAEAPQKFVEALHVLEEHFQMWRAALPGGVDDIPFDLVDDMRAAVQDPAVPYAYRMRVACHLTRPEGRALVALPGGQWVRWERGDEPMDPHDPHAATALEKIARWRVDVEAVADGRFTAERLARRHEGLEIQFALAVEAEKALRAILAKDPTDVIGCEPR
jgi:hypothetical protein